MTEFSTELKRAKKLGSQNTITRKTRTDSWAEANYRCPQCKGDLYVENILDTIFGGWELKLIIQEGARNNGR